MKRSALVLIGLGGLALACQGQPRPAPDAAPAASMPVAAAPAGAPLPPAALAELQSNLGQLQELVTQANGASQQGRARMIQRQLEVVLDRAEMKGTVPFRKNIERIVAILSEGGDELTDKQRQEIKQEIEAILRELGLDKQGDTASSNSGESARLPGPGRDRPGPGPGGPGPGPGPGGPGPGPGGPGPGPRGPGGPGPGGPRPPGPPQP